ncbi:hypothetical protein DICPUDRAFT_156240 [Dictyostelium purpureum]|uniref:FERM domain-containing protein n=1 Tax=Dictyostelium purpureum TaxID=5786 RepID=F0ZW30_DICPU|nr:uncharacterized protein DICPUDRAFT_156240 [Dictyostelium purpureum]EGC31859.1 hypothetical protein DICPUDRAFT_156240 [Dictyostelium purpureum]|eukprot:XP_003291629.1 hypothetical protein DICPUDRAFT_156240 [Dictyostelium purpureum]
MESVEDDLEQLLNELTSPNILNNISEKLKQSEPSEFSENHSNHNHNHNHGYNQNINHAQQYYQTNFDDETGSNAEDVRRLLEETDSNYGGSTVHSMNTTPNLYSMRNLLHTELSLDALKPVSENSPLHMSATRPVSTSVRLPRLSICEEDDSELSSDDVSSSDSDYDDDSSTSSSLSLRNYNNAADNNVQIKDDDSDMESSESSEQYGSPSNQRRKEILKLEKQIQIQEKKRILKEKIQEQDDAAAEELSLNKASASTTATVTTTTTSTTTTTIISDSLPPVPSSSKSRSVSVSSNHEVSHPISKERKRSILQSFEEGSPLRSSSRLPSSRGGSIKIKVSKVLEEEIQLQQEFEKQEQIRNSARLSQVIRELNMSTIFDQKSDDGETKQEESQQEEPQQEKVKTLTPEEEEIEIAKQEAIERMREQVFSQLDLLEDPIKATAKLSSKAGEPSKKDQDSEASASSPTLEPSTVIPLPGNQANRFLNTQTRPRKDSISDRWDIGRKEQPRRSMTLHIQRVGEDFSVKRQEVKKVNAELEKILVHISLVDQSHKVICITEDFLVQDVILLFAEKLGLVQTEFFSLAEVTVDGYDRWLDPTKLVKEAGIKNLSKLVFKIKYFKQPKRLSDSKAVHLYYLQIQQSVVSGTYPCSEAMSFRLAALQFYITFGAHDKEKHAPGFLDSGSLSEFIPEAFFFELPDEIIQKRLFLLHSQIKCSSVIEAKLRYLDLSNKIPTFGVTSFQVHDGVRESSIARHKRNLCVAEDGVLISRKDRAGYDFFSYKEIIGYQVTTRGLKIQIPHSSVTPNTSENISFDTSSYEQSANIVELMSGYKYFIQHDEFIRGIGSPIEKVDLNISVLLPLFQSPKVRTKSDPLRSRLELFKINYLTLCQNFHTKPILKLIEQIDHVLDKEGGFRENLNYDKIELPSLNLKGSDLSFIADALKDSLNTVIEEGESIVENLNILTLDLSTNQMLALDAFEPLKIIMTCNTIVHLNLKNIGLPNKLVMSLVTIIEKYPKIETLNISKNRIDESGVRVILRAIKNFNKNIETLGFEDINLTDSGCKVIEKLLSNNKTLKSLNISKNKISEAGFKIIFEGIKKATNLQDLNISGNPIQSKIMTKFIKYIASSETAIQKLNIGNTGLNTGLGSEIQKYLVSTSCHLTSLDVAYNNLGADGTKNIIKGVVNNHIINDLSLSANKIDYNGCNELCNLLELSSANTKTLYIRYCELSSRSLVRVCKMLELNATINVLDLSMNKFSKQTATAIAHSLERNRTLEDLFLTQASMSHTEIDIISAGIQKNQKIKRLFLDVNPIGKKGINSLAQMVNNNTSLEALGLRNTNLNSKDILEFLKQLNQNISIKTINLTENNLEKITQQTKLLISDQLKRLQQVNIQY